MNKIIERAQQIIAGAVPPPPIGALIGMRLVAVETGRARFELDADARHHNPMGTLHGGILCDIADGAMGMAYASTLEEGDTGHLVAEGVVVQRGRTVGLAECSVTDERGRLVAKATSTCLTLRGEPATGR